PLAVTSTPRPYTTLFRSRAGRRQERRHVVVSQGRDPELPTEGHRDHVRDHAVNVGVPVVLHRQPTSASEPLDRLADLTGSALVCQDRAPDLRRIAHRRPPAPALTPPGSGPTPEPASRPPRARTPSVRSRPGGNPRSPPCAYATGCQLPCSMHPRARSG